MKGFAMLDMAEDEQEAFIERQKKKVFEGLKSVESPTYTALVGAKGAGKSTLMKNLKNNAKISPDEIIADYYEEAGIDARGNFYDKEIGKFASKVSNSLFMEAVKNKYNIAYDAGYTNQTESLIKKMASYGYDIKIKAVLADDMQAQLNVAKRKLDFDEEKNLLAQGKNVFQTSQNPLQTPMSLSEKSSLDVLDFLYGLDAQKFPFEVYEYGKKTVAFDSKKSKIGFDEYLDDFMGRLDDPKKYKTETKGLIDKAKKLGNQDLEMELIAFRNKHFGGR